VGKQGLPWKQMLKIFSGCDPAAPGLPLSSSTSGGELYHTMQLALKQP